MTSAGSRLSKMSLSVVLVLALIIGGGTGQGLYTDFIVQIAVILAAAIAFSAQPSSAVAPAGIIIFFLLILAGIIQVAPLPGLVNIARVVSSDATFTTARPFVSLGVGQSVESLIFALTAVLFSLALMRLSMDQLAGLLPFFFVGLSCNLLASLMQFSLTQNVEITSFLPYTITSGTFANVNHFSSLLFLSIPLIVYFGIFLNRIWIAISAISLILLVLLAGGSRAGMAIGLAVAVLSVVFLTWRSRVGGASTIAMLGLVTVFGYGAIEKIGNETLDADFGRAEFARTTIDGIGDNWLLGVGYGNFAKAYQAYENSDMIFANYVNHAHNDYLEMAFEGGVFAILIIALYIVLLIWTSRIALRDPFKRAALLSIIFVLFHSLVDYPLRTMAIALSFAFLNAVYFHRATSLRPGAIKGSPELA